jgi:hypothetical protein
MERDMSQYRTPEYHQALIKALNRRGEPRTFHDFEENDFVQIELIPVRIGDVMTESQYLEGRLTVPKQSRLLVEDASADLFFLAGHEVGVGSDTTLKPPRSNLRVPVTLFHSMVAGREAVFFRADEADTFYSKFQHPTPEIQHRPHARYGRVMVRGLELFDVRGETTL